MLDGAATVRFRQIGQSFSHARLFGAIAMFAKTLQVEQLIAAAVFLRDNVVDVRVRLANFFAALDARVPTVIRFVVLEPFFAITHVRTPCRLLRPCAIIREKIFGGLDYALEKIFAADFVDVLVVSRRGRFRQKIRAARTHRRIRANGFRAALPDVFLGTVAHDAVLRSSGRQSRFAA